MNRRSLPGQRASSRGFSNFSCGNARTTLNGGGGSGEPTTRDVVQGTRAGSAPAAYVRTLKTPSKTSQLRLLLRLGQIRNEAEIIFCACGDLDHRNPHLGREELLVIGPLVGVAAAAAAVLDHQVHLLDAFRPDDRVVLPERLHRDVLFVNALFLVQVGARAAVAVLLALVGNVAERPRGRLAAGGLLDDLGADVHGPVAIIDWLPPALGAIGI